MKILQFVVGPVSTNCYFAVNEATKETLIVDPGAQGPMLIRELDSRELTPVAILLTHGHFDHAGAAGLLADHYGISVYASRLEEETLSDPRLNLSLAFTGQADCYRADVFTEDHERLQLAGLSIEVLSTPGHTAGGCCYYIAAEQALFSGDTLFCGSVGRTDFPGGSQSTLVGSIRSQLLDLPDATAVYPGHDATTTMGQEKEYNPFV